MYVFIIIYYKLNSVVMFSSELCKWPEHFPHVQTHTPTNTNTWDKSDV